MGQIIKNKSTRINMFEPPSVNDAMMDKINKLLAQYDIDNQKPCVLHFERMARSVAGIVLNFKVNYGLTLSEIEDKYNLGDLRKGFACNNVNLCILNSEVCSPIGTSNNILLTTKGFSGIITELDEQITIIL